MIIYNYGTNSYVLFILNGLTNGVSYTNSTRFMTVNTTITSRRISFYSESRADEQLNNRNNNYRYACICFN